MKIVEFDINNVPEEYTNINLCLGFFDGVHLGHQAMIKKAVSSGDTGVMTFDISPSFTLGKTNKYSNITSLYPDKDNSGGCKRSRSKHRRYNRNTEHEGCVEAPSADC